MNGFKVNFRELKSRVGIDDVAYALGYKLDRKAGVGRYIELVLGEGKEKRDTIIVCNPKDKAAQLFFRRDGSKGDVVTLIKENLHAFPVSGANDWQKVARVMARFANMPEPAYSSDREYVRQAGKNTAFDKSRYEVKRLDMDHIPQVFLHRGFSRETVRTFGPFISLIRDRLNEKFDGYNVGFPYTCGEDKKIRGYEIRGTGRYKAKAAGTDSSSAAWVADLSGNNDVTSLFFFESAFDAMAFYQINRTLLNGNVALVSIGGTFSDGQITGVLNRFPTARVFGCFDNDIPGRLYILRLLSVVENVPMKISREDGGIKVEAKGCRFSLDMGRPVMEQVADRLSIRYRTGQWQPPEIFKDWNDCLLDNPMTIVPFPKKRDREKSLTEQRSNQFKL